MYSLLISSIPFGWGGVPVISERDTISHAAIKDCWFYNVVNRIQRSERPTTERRIESWTINIHDLKFFPPKKIWYKRDKPNKLKVTPAPKANPERTMKNDSIIRD
jgi:hypothetical protein